MWFRYMSCQKCPFPLRRGLVNLIQYSVPWAYTTLSLYRLTIGSAVFAELKAASIHSVQRCGLIVIFN